MNLWGYLVRSIFALVLMGAWQVHAADLTIHGSNTVGEHLGPTLVKAWLESEGYSDINEQTVAENERVISAQSPEGQTIEIAMAAHGSSTGFKGLLTEKADIAMASRPVKSKEILQGKSLGMGDLGDIHQETVIALDGVAVIVHPDSPIQSLSIGEIQSLFTGAKKQWNGLGGMSGPVRVLARDDNSGTFDTFKSLVLQGKPLSAQAERFESTDTLAKIVAGDKQAIGFVGLAGVGSAKAISVADGVVALSPSTSAVAVEDYPLSRRLYLYSKKSPSPLAKSLLAYVVGNEAQDLVASTGFVSQKIAPYKAVVRDDTPDSYKELVKDAQRLSVNFRFDSGDRLVQSKTMHDITRLSEFLQRPENQGRYLRLIGFSDDVEASDYFSEVISVERADLIHALLLKEGVRASVVRGMGDSAPVASNQTKNGRAKNRRVEVWLGRSPVATETMPSVAAKGS